MQKIHLGFALLLLFAQCTIKKYNPTYTFDPQKVPQAPDYTQLSAWAALPQVVDGADRTPDPAIKDNQVSAAVDVFFLHPTMLLASHKHGDVWNGDLKDQKLNELTDEVPVLLQSSAFNGAGRVYAPRYRQAHYWSFLTKDHASAKQALDIAYTDVRAAFRYYIEHYNQGRPFILVGHSQGSRHAIQLLKEEIETTDLKSKLVAAYIPGWPVKVGEFKQLKPCATPSETGCFCTWRTFERNFGLKYAVEDSIWVTNPINWALGNGHYAPTTMHQGAVLRNFKKVHPGICDAEPYRGVLLCSRPKFRGSFLIRTKNYHPGDINLYYMDIRENAILRANTFLNPTNPK